MDEGSKKDVIGFFFLTSPLVLLFFVLLTVDVTEENVGGLQLFINAVGDQDLNESEKVLNESEKIVNICETNFYSFTPPT